MIVTTFDPADDLIVVQAYVRGARDQKRELRLVVDTASEILAREHGEQVASTRSIAGREEGYMLRVT